jgi:hypothetical protein
VSAAAGSASIERGELHWRDYHPSSGANPCCDCWHSRAAPCPQSSGQQIPLGASVAVSTSCSRSSAKNPLAKAIDCRLKRWSTFERFLDDGRICMTNRARYRSWQKNWTFCGSDTGGERAAVIFTLIETAKLCDADARAWLAAVLARIADHRRAVSTSCCRGSGKLRSSSKCT